MKRFTEWLLHLAEVVYLESHGWKKVKPVWGAVSWMPPDSYYWGKKIGQEHEHGHAVNSQKSATGNERRERELREAGLIEEE